MVRVLRLAVLLAILQYGPAAGDAALQFSVEALDGAGWRAAGVRVEVHREDAGRLVATLRARRLELPAPIGTLENVAAECLDLAVSAARFACRSLRLVPGADLPNRLRVLAGRAQYRRDTGAVSWALGPQGSDDLSFEGSLDPAGWRVRLAATDWPLDELAWLGRLVGRPPPALGGTIDLSITARGVAEVVEGAVFDIRASGVGGANESGTVAAEDLGFELRGSAWRSGDSLAFDARGAIAAGEAYVEPVYTDLAAHPLRLNLRGTLHADHIEIGQLVIEQAGTLHADARGTLALADDGSWRLGAGRLRLAEATLPGAYTTFLQPFLAGTALGDLETSGLLRGELELVDGELAELWLELSGVNLDDRAARLAVHDLDGDLGWAPAGDGGMTARARPAELRWSGGFVYGIPFGAARVRMDAYAGRWSLPVPISIPVLDGALEIERLEFGDFMAGDDDIQFEARLAPVSMRELSRALDWPPLSGRLSGALPRLSYRDGVLSMGGDLSAEVFSGTVAIRQLRIERPLQPLARLQAEVQFQGIELAELTEALSFGLMTGRLDGYVHGLEMIDWAPVAFDARIYTPPDSRARQRISQRAVDNIASIGGGGAGVLSTGFLRFFEDFSYAGFALGCRLERDVCRMSGLEARDDGYVILRGSGLPRIDVMGFARDVSWSALVEQIAGIMAAEGAEIR
jgi:hypothetical protein